MRRCATVSTVAQFPRLSVGTILILWSLTFVGRMSCIILYHSALFVPDTGASPTFLHTVDQSVCGQSLVMRISWVPDSALSIVCNVSYIRLLYVCNDSELPCNGIYTVLNRRLGGPQNRSVRLEKRKSSFLYRDSNLGQYSQLLVAISNTLSRFPSPCVK